VEEKEISSNINSLGGVPDGGGSVMVKVSVCPAIEEGMLPPHNV
jgi:hypothetical protein